MLFAWAAGQQQLERIIIIYHFSHSLSRFFVVLFCIIIKPKPKSKQQQLLAAHFYWFSAACLWWFAFELISKEARKPSCQLCALSARTRSARYSLALINKLDVVDVDVYWKLVLLLLLFSWQNFAKLESHCLISQPLTSSFFALLVDCLRQPEEIDCRLQAITLVVER